MESNYFVSTDKALFNLKVIHDFLTNCYWSSGISMERIQEGMNHSLCFGVYLKNSQDITQVGFARVISDFSSFTYLCDVFVVEEHRKRGLSKLLMENIKNHPNLQNLRRWTLATRDAHKLYEQFGFHSLKTPDRYMEIFNPNIYK